MFLSLLCNFELIEQVALVDFLLYLNIFKILRISFSTFWIACLVLWTLFSLKPCKAFSIVQTAMISKAMISPALLDTSTTASLCIFSSIMDCSLANQKNSIMDWSKYWCHQKTKKKTRHCMKFSSTSNTSVQRCLHPVFQNQLPHFLLPTLFQRISQPWGQDQQNGKRIYHRLRP